MVRRLFKTAMAWALHRSGADQFIGRMDGFRSMPLVLCYHRVVEDFAASARKTMPAMLISTRTLERQLDWIGRRFCFVSLEELGSWLEGEKNISRPVAAVIFDDGYRDVHTHAFPLLKRKGIPAAVSVVTDFIGTSEMQIYDRLYGLLLRRFVGRPSGAEDLGRLLAAVGIRRPADAALLSLTKEPHKTLSALVRELPQAEILRLIKVLEAGVDIPENDRLEFRSLDWAMLAEMHRAGISIASHTKSHALLTNESRQTVLEEVQGSRRELERRMGIEVKHIAYPDGHFNSAVIDAVAASGYRFGYTTCSHRDSRYPLLTVPRTILWENACMDFTGSFSPAILSCQIHRVFDFASGCRQPHASNRADYRRPRFVEIQS